MLPSGLLDYSLLVLAKTLSKHTNGSIWMVDRTAVDFENS